MSKFIEEAPEKFKGDHLGMIKAIEDNYDKHKGLISSEL